jgi:hypothetical protein
MILKRSVYKGRCSQEIRFLISYEFSKPLIVLLYVGAGATRSTAETNNIARCTVSNALLINNAQQFLSFKIGLVFSGGNFYEFQIAKSCFLFLLSF